MVSDQPTRANCQLFRRMLFWQKIEQDCGRWVTTIIMCITCWRLYSPSSTIRLCLYTFVLLKNTLKIAKRKRAENKLFIENVNKQRDDLFIIRFFLEQLFHIQSSVWQLTIHSAQWEQFAQLQNDRYNKDKTCKERQVGRGQIYNMYITISIRKS